MNRLRAVFCLEPWVEGAGFSSAAAIRACVDPTATVQAGPGNRARNWEGRYLFFKDCFRE